MALAGRYSVIVADGGDTQGLPENPVVYESATVYNSGSSDTTVTAPAGALIDGADTATVPGGENATFLYVSASYGWKTVSKSVASFGSLTATGPLTLKGLPTADPLVVGALWNDAGAVKASAGPPP